MIEYCTRCRKNLLKDCVQTESSEEILKYQPKKQNCSLKYVTNGNTDNRSNRPWTGNVDGSS